MTNTTPVPSDINPCPSWCELFPEPTEPYYPGYEVPGAVFGHHRDFCIVGEDREPGTLVADHGAACEGWVGSSFPGFQRDGSTDPLRCSVVAPYMHGVYDPNYLRSGEHRKSYVRIANGEDRTEADGEWIEAEIYVSASTARSLAAALIHAADRLEKLS